MGHMSRFNFPIPGRKSKPVPPPPPSPLTTPRTKADKILGTGDVLDAAPLESPRYAWETRSLSAISITVSDTATSHSHAATGTGTGATRVAVADHGPTARPSTVGKNPRWEEESGVLPRSFREQTHLPPARTAHEAITDASSLRRRQSSSTITSYYDKTKLPLSISQQTSNSAMAKGLPTKAQALLDMEGAYADAAGETKKKKPARLDLSSLIPGKSKSKFLSPRTLKGLVLGPDLVTKSPSAMSVSTGDATPPPISQRADRRLRKKATKESMRDVPPIPEVPDHVRVPPTKDGARHRHTKSTVDLMNLYDHYEQRTFADADGVEDDVEAQAEPTASYPTPPASLCGNGHLSAEASNPIRIVVGSKESPPAANPQDLLMGMSPLSLITPPPDNASVSSRHTRTSKASKQTNLSLTDLDLQQNSMLSLSSDSEDDDYAVSSKSSLAVPPLSDGQPSPTSSHSAVSQRSTATMAQESNRAKVPKRTSFAAQPQFHPIPEGSATASALRIAPRSSSLSPRMAVPKPRSSLYHNSSLSSIATTSTGRTVAAPGARASDTNIAPRKVSPPRHANWSAPALDRFDEFPAPPTPHSRQQSLTPSNHEPTPPLSPTSVDFYLQERLSRTTLDNQSIRSGRSLGSSSLNDAQRGGTPNGHRPHDSVGSASGRFMAVTRQEEMLLAALRQKRARMREDIMAELEDNDADDDGANPLQRQITNGSGSGMSRQSSRSTVRTTDGAGLGAPSARLQRAANQRVPSTGERGGRGQILVMMDRTTMGHSGSGIDTAEPSPDLDGFLGFDEMMDLPAIPPSTRSAPRQRSSSKASVESKGSSRSLSGKGSLSGLTRAQFGGGADSSSMGSGSRRGSDKNAIREEDEEEPGIPRPDSPISPDDFPLPAAMSSRKQVRLSAVGNYQPPNIEAGWWDDSG